MVIVSLTSIPPRFKYLNQVIDNIKNQITSNDVIILNIPYSYSRFPDVKFDVPRFDGVLINRCKDYGPATKLLGTLLHPICEPDDSIIVIDDDVVYNSRFVSVMLEEQIKNPESVITMHCYPISGMESIPKLGPDCEHFVAGNCGFIVKARFFQDPDIFKLDPNTPYFYVDDVWISGFLTKDNIQIRLSSTRFDSVQDHAYLIFPLHTDRREERNHATIRYFQDTYNIWK